MMLYTIPDYYKEFRCIADKCEDTCCAGWQIAIDKKSLARYRQVKGDFGKRMRRSVRWSDGTFRRVEDRRCTFLNEDNLCDLYRALGEGGLCRTCRLYPRHIEEFEGVLPFNDKVSPAIIKREFGLSKNAFKRAVGRLLKQGRIEITENRIIKR